MAEVQKSVPRARANRVHLVVGGTPIGAHNFHDIDYVRLRLLSLFAEFPLLRASVAGDYADPERYLPKTQLLVTYAAGPHPGEAEHRALRAWLEAGGRWLALHGSSASSGTEPDPDHPGAVRVPRFAFHETLGCRFLSHPPIRRVRVEVSDGDHPLARGLPAHFEVEDELYFNVLEGGERQRTFLTTPMPEDLPPESFPEGNAPAANAGALLPDGRSLPVAYTKELGQGGVAYIALGHAYSPVTNWEPFVDASMGAPPALFRGPWPSDAYETLLRNGVAWGLGGPHSP